jgi:hypothetical protein
MNAKENSEFAETLNVFFQILWLIWCVPLMIIDGVVCGDIFYTAIETAGGYSWSYVAQLYSLAGLNSELSHWLLVYGATSVTKFAFYPALIVNPVLILIINSYLYATSLSIDNILSTECANQPFRNETSTTSCQVYNYQWPQLKLLNSIQLWGSIALVGLIPVLILVFFSVNVFVFIPGYLYDVTVRFHKTLCCGCYRRGCQNFYHIFCYGPEAEPKPVMKPVSEVLQDGPRNPAN